jgi:UDP-N-acetylmuramoylalanine-D-glutamate ligase
VLIAATGQARLVRHSAGFASEGVPWSSSVKRGAHCGGRRGALPVEHAGSMDDISAALLSPRATGDAVLLTPCSSFDMFKSYADQAITFAAVGS